MALGVCITGMDDDEYIVCVCGVNGGSRAADDGVCVSVPSMLA
jgi:hypothetical protein